MGDHEGNTGRRFASWKLRGPAGFTASWSGAWGRAGAARRWLVFRRIQRRALVVVRGRNPGRGAATKRSWLASASTRPPAATFE